MLDQFRAITAAVSENYDSKNLKNAAQMKLEVQIVPLGNNIFTFKAEGTGVDLTGLTNPCQSLQKTPSSAPPVATRKPPERLAPDKISLARLPVTGSELFGREGDLTFLDRAWAKKEVNVVSIVAWAGVGKSTLVNHWLRRMTAKHYRSAEPSLAGPFTGRAVVEVLPQQMNFLMPLSLGLATQIHGSERRGRRAKD